MTRGSFFKILATVIASPGIITSLKVKDVFREKSHTIKKAAAFKITEEMQKDEVALKIVTEMAAKNSGIDLGKSFNCDFGYSEDDFTKNILTCVISQYE